MVVTQTHSSAYPTKIGTDSHILCAMFLSSLAFTHTLSLLHTHAHSRMLSHILQHACTHRPCFEFNLCSGVVDCSVKQKRGTICLPDVYMVCVCVCVCVCQSVNVYFSACGHDHTHTHDDTQIAPQKSGTTDVFRRLDSHQRFTFGRKKEPHWYTHTHTHTHTLHLSMRCAHLYLSAHTRTLGHAHVTM
jgi:hypothetical protein